MRDKALVLGDEERKPLRADADAVDRAPQLFERNLSDYPTSLLTGRHDSHGNRRARKAVVVELQRRDVDAIRIDIGRRRNGERRVAGPAGCDQAAAGAKKADLAELRKIDAGSP